MFNAKFTKSWTYIFFISGQFLEREVMKANLLVWSKKGLSAEIIRWDNMEEITMLKRTCALTSVDCVT